MDRAKRCKKGSKILRMHSEILAPNTVEVVGHGKRTRTVKMHPSLLFTSLLCHLNTSPLVSFRVPKYPRREAPPRAPNQPGSRGTYALTLHPLTVPRSTTPMRAFHILKSTESLSSGSYTCCQGLSDAGNCFLLDSSMAAFDCKM